MSSLNHQVLAVVVPLFNEGAGLPAFHKSLVAATEEAVGDKYEIIYCDDGSTDNTAELVSALHHKDARVRLVVLSRNFGKEYALTAGIAQAEAQAVLTIDGDGQHPVELISQFVAAWKAGAQVVTGVRTGNQDEGLVKQIGSRVFYKLFNTFTSHKLTPGSTDYCLIDKQVQQAFLALTETDRMTRGLIDWLGFRKTTISFQAKPRLVGTAGYSSGKLLGLAANSFISLSPVPLYLFGCLGIFITSGALILGSAVFLEQLLLGDPWRWRFTGTAMLGILILFLVGIVLMSQGILSLYLSHVQNQTKRRPLYVIDHNRSEGLHH